MIRTYPRETPMTMTSTGIDTTYNGWANYETWNVSLYIGNDYGCYCLAKEIVEQGGTYGDFVNMIGYGKTPDGVKWDDVNIDGIEVNEMMQELVDG